MNPASCSQNILTRILISEVKQTLGSQKFLQGFSFADRNMDESLKQLLYFILFYFILFYFSLFYF
jgi:hypothetical protein